MGTLPHSVEVCYSNNEVFMAGTVATNPIEKARMEVFKQMKPELQAVAKRFEDKTKDGALGVLMLQYNMGAQLKDVVASEEKYGTGAVKQLATYLSIPGGAATLYSIMNFASAFDKEYVKTQTMRPMSNGGYLSLMHWIHLTKLSDEGKRTKLLERVLKESMSTGDLEREIQAGAAGALKNKRQGGRKPKTPTSPVVGLQATTQLANKFNNWQAVAIKSVFEVLEEIEPDKVTDALLAKAEESLKSVQAAGKTATAMEEQLTTSIEHMKEVLEKRAETAAEEYTEDTEEAPKKKVKTAEASANGTGKKKKKKKKPVAAE